VPIPSGVEVAVDGQLVRVKGPKGELQRQVHPEMSVQIEDGHIQVTRPSEVKRHKALHGLTRTLVANMVEGVTKGFSKELEIKGVGYRASQSIGSDHRFC